MRRWGRRGPNRRHQGNGRRNVSESGNSRSHNQGNSSGPPPAAPFAAAAPQPLAPSSAPGPPPAFTAAPIVWYDPAFSGNTNPNARRPGTVQVPPTPTPWRFEDSATSVSLSTALLHGCPPPPPVNTNTQVIYTGPSLRPCHPLLTPEPATSDGNDPPTGTSIQRCGETGTSDTDIRVLCPSRDRPPHGHASTGVGSFGSSAGLFSLPAIHELPLDDSSSDADSKVDAHPPYPIQIGVCPQSRQTPDLGTPASQLTAVGHTQDRAATGPAAVVLHHFLDAENAFLNKKEDPSHSSSANCSEPSASIHNTNATADLSSYNGTPATLGQHNDCPDRDNTERPRPVTTPSVPPSHDLRPPFVPLEHAHAAYDASLTYISDDVVLFWHPPSVFSQWTLLPFTVDLVENNCAEQFMMASKARLLAMIRRSQPSSLQTTPEDKNASAVKCVTLTPSSGNTNAKTLYSMATLQKFPKTGRCTLPSFKPATAASPKQALTTTCGASA